jgi:hypothetical protein
LDTLEEGFRVFYRAILKKFGLAQDPGIKPHSFFKAHAKSFQERPVLILIGRKLEKITVPFSQLLAEENKFWLWSKGCL